MRTRRTPASASMKLEAVGGVVGIEGEVGGAGLEGGEECDDHVEGAGEGDADEGLGAGAAGRAASGPGGWRGRRARRRRGWWARRRRRRRRRRVRRGCGRPSPRRRRGWGGQAGKAAGGAAFQAASWACFGGGEQRQAADGRYRAGRTAAASRRGEVAGHAADRRRVEQVDVVLERAGKPVAVRRHHPTSRASGRRATSRLRASNGLHPERAPARDADAGRPARPACELGRLKSTWKIGL